MENFNTFIKKILLGDKSIHDPILVRITNTTSENIPFMEYLLKYKNINKNNLLESLHAILNLFRKKFHSLHNDNDNIKELFSNVKNEWHLDENDDILNLFKSSINSEFFSKYEKCKLEYNKGCNLCDELIELDENESNIPIESIFQNELPINRKASGLLFLCNDIYKFIEGFIKKMELILNEYKSYKNSILIDLSTRLKSCYNCNNIPNNIHTIFMNYIIIHNFFYKELMNIYYQLLEYLNKIKENCEIMKRTGLIIYLYVSESCLFERLKRDKKRPLLKSGNRRETISKIFKIRDPLYKQIADIKYVSNGLLIKRSVSDLIKKIEEFS